MRPHHLALLALLAPCVAALLIAGCAPPSDNEVIFGDVDDLPNSLAFAVVEGSDPPAQTLLITNVGTCVLDYTVTVSTVDTAPWLSVTPTSGSVAASLGSASLSVAAAVIAESLTPGLYTGTATIAATCQDTGNAAVGSPADVSINLSVVANNAILGVSDDDLEIDVPVLTSATWTSMGTAGAAADRFYAASAWGGYEFFVAGGQGLPLVSNTYDSAAAYNPSTDTWRTIASTPVTVGNGIGLWAGGRFVILGGINTTSAVSIPLNALVYDPAPSANAWSTASGTGAALTNRDSLYCAATDGDQVYFWGGFDSSSNYVTTNVGAAFDPVTDTTVALGDTGQPTNDSLANCALSGDEFFVVTDDQLGRYDLSTGVWTTSDLPTTIHSDHMVWTGKQLVIPSATQGEVYTWTRSSNLWEVAATFINQSNVLGNMGNPAVWTGRVVLFLGIGSINQYAAFDPESGTVTAMGSDLGSDGRFGGQSHLWTGDRLLVFGGLRLNSSSVNEVAPGGGVLQ